MEYIKPDVEMLHGFYLAAKLNRPTMHTRLTKYLDSGAVAVQLLPMMLISGVRRASSRLVIRQSFRMRPQVPTTV